MRRSLVLDQSTTTVGYAIVAEDPETLVSFGVTGRLIQHGVIETPRVGLLDRLNVIRADLRELISTYKPDEMVIENTMFIAQRSGQTAHAMAAIYALCQEIAKERNLDFYTQNPRTIKKLLTSDGSADKAEVTEVVKRVWGLSQYQIIDDNHADALAAAYVWLYRGEDVRAEKALKSQRKRRRV